MEKALNIIENFLKENGYSFTWALGDKSMLCSPWVKKEEYERVITIEVENGIVMVTTQTEIPKVVNGTATRSCTFACEDVNIADPDAFDRILAFVEKHW